MPAPRLKKMVDEVHVISTRRGNGKVRVETWVDGTGKVVRYNLAYINHLTSVPIQNQYAALSLPIWKASYEPSVKLADVPAEVIQVAKGQLGNMLLRPQVPQYNAVSHVLQAELQNGLTGKKSAQQALDDAAAQAKSLMAG